VATVAGLHGCAFVGELDRVSAVQRRSWTAAEYNGQSKDANEETARNGAHRTAWFFRHARYAALATGPSALQVTLIAACAAQSPAPGIYRHLFLEVALGR
jgi:hypothetical protein